MIGGLLAPGGALVLLGQCFLWLRSGNWTPIFVGMVLYAIGARIADYELSWVGVQKMIDAVMASVIDWPASIVLIVIGAMFSILAEIVESKAWNIHTDELRSNARRRP